MLKESFLSAQPIPSLGLLVFFFIIENDPEVSCLQDKHQIILCFDCNQCLVVYIPPSQQNLLELMLPAILLYMTTHHHNLRSFAQVQQSTVKPCPLIRIFIHLNGKNLDVLGKNEMLKMVE
jgi:hypothetical protein